MSKKTKKTFLGLKKFFRSEKPVFMSKKSKKPVIRSKKSKNKRQWDVC